MADFNLNKLAGTIKSLFHRLLGQGGTEVCAASTATGRYHTLYVAETATFTAVTGGGPKSSTWLTEIPAGSTLTASAGEPIQSFTISTGKVLAYS